MKKLLCNLVCVHGREPREIKKEETREGDTEILDINYIF